MQLLSEERGRDRRGEGGGGGRRKRRRRTRRRREKEVQKGQAKSERMSRRCRVWRSKEATEEKEKKPRD